MLTEKLYYKNSHINSFSAKVILCEKSGDKFNVILDKTAFFPESGGQPGDSGKIDNINISDTQIENNEIVHKADFPIEVGKTVECEIDWKVRFNRMQNHTGEHIMSGVIHNKYGFENVGFHMSKGFVTMDTGGVLSKEQVSEIEYLANEVVFKNVSVNAYFPTDSELEKINFRCKSEIDGAVRIVEIDGCDICACCAPHVSRTGEVGLIKVLNFHPYKGGTRFEIACGYDALNDYIRLHEMNSSIMQILSAKRDEITEAVQRQKDLENQYSWEIKKLKEQMAVANFEKTEFDNVICGFLSDCSYDEMRACLNNINTEKTVAIFSQNGEEFLYIISTVGDVKPVVADMNKALNGRGGGRNNFAQGKISADKDDIINYFKLLDNI